MQQLHTSTVTREQIDHLGHMNVRFYAALAETGARSLAARLGLAGEGDPTIWVPDIHVRHHHEQLVDAPLEVWGGVVDARAERLRLYEELANVDSGQLAATFVIALSAASGPDRRPAPFSSEGLARAMEHVVEVPEHGRARSVSFDGDPAERAPSLDDLRARGLAQRQERVLEPFECDDDGWYRSDLLGELIWGGAAVEGRSFQPFHTTPDGRTMGWATMETRATWARLPRAGDRVQSFGAEVGLAAKTMHSRHWVYEVDRSELVCVFSIVGVAFDLESRRSMVIPDQLREALGQRLHPDLAQS